VVTNRYVIGLDLGPPAAFTALAVIERSDSDVADTDPTYAVRHLHRFPPGTSYERVAKAVFDLRATETLEDAPVVVDITATGSAVLEAVRAGVSEWALTAAILTAGHHAECVSGGWSVPKKDLVTGLQLLLQGRRLAIPLALPEADLLTRELGTFRSRASLAVDPAQAEWREGRDDDLVLAVALGCWHAARLPSPYLDDMPQVICQRFQNPSRYFSQPWSRPWG
jgi:hypothetical protein